MSFDLAAMRAALFSPSRYNRLMTLQPDAQQHYITFRAKASSVLKMLTEERFVPLSDRRLSASQCWSDLTPVLPVDEREMRLQTLQLLQDYRFEETGGYTLYVALRFALVKFTAAQGQMVCSVPLGFLPVVLDRVDGEIGLRRIGRPRPNLFAARVLGQGVEAIPGDSLTWTQEDLAPFGCKLVYETATLGMFDLDRCAIYERTDPARHPYVLQHPAVQQLLLCRADNPWPNVGLLQNPPPFRYYDLLDEAQSLAGQGASLGRDLMIESAPGTGKTRTLKVIVTHAVRNGQSVLFLGGRMSAVRAYLAAMAGISPILDRTLVLGGRVADPEMVARRLGIEAQETVQETLSAYPSQIRFVATTPAMFAMHVPDTWRFDLLVIDEGSLIPLLDALPAVAACRQIVIAGDRQQGRKTPLIYEMADEDTYVRDAPTLMDGAAIGGIPTILLPFHYRSRHPALMAMAATKYYRGRVTLCPSPMESEWFGTAVKQVPGVFDRTRIENRIEAEAVVDEIVRHVESGNGASVGVAAMNWAQAALIQKILDERGIDVSPVTGKESLLITDFENIQGEERDVIILSLMVSHDPSEGEHRYDFGVLTYPDGERRLNVITTRARNLTVAVISFPLSAIPIEVSREHLSLFTHLHYMSRSFSSETRIEEGPLAPVAAHNGWTVRNYRGAYGMYEPRVKWFPVLIYVTGRHSPTADASNLARFRNGRWTVHEITQEQFEAILADETLQREFAEELRKHYQPELPPERQAEGEGPLAHEPA